MVEDKSEEYVVKGDGPCLLRTTAAHNYGNENEGVNMAQMLNKHQSNYKDHYKEKISVDFPMTVKLGRGGETRTFEKSDDFFNWLEGSEEATYLWRGCLDLMAVSNMLHMNIDLVLYEEGKKPDLVVFKPDLDFPWIESDPMKPGNKMIVLNWKDLHYNLIVSPNHMLSQHGSFDFQKSDEITLKEVNQS